MTLSGQRKLLRFDVRLLKKVSGLFRDNYLSEEWRYKTSMEVTELTKQIHITSYIRSRKLCCAGSGESRAIRKKYCGKRSF